MDVLRFLLKLVLCITCAGSIASLIAFSSFAYVSVKLVNDPWLVIEPWQLIVTIPLCLVSTTGFIYMLRDPSEPEEEDECSTQEKNSQ